MDIKAKIELSKKNIWQAIDDYGAHTDQIRVLEDISQPFVDRLAEDNAHAKYELRELFRKSPVWNEELDCLVINGTRTHNPNRMRIYSLAKDILREVRLNSSDEKTELIDKAIHFFAYPDENPSLYISAIKELAPRAYAKNKKPSRVFKALCDKLGVSDDRAGSEFQRLYAQFADELNAKKIDFKLFVSINPAHFLTMSNPKEDKRGNTLTSCHSLNSTEYEYNCGCSGYARDEYSFIVFTVADPKISETLNNRKTTRQIFAYKPNNGLLLQSRLYNTSGGTYGGGEDSKLYRDLVQREISALENVPNLWNTFNYLDNDKCVIEAGKGFGGYTDWTYKDFDAKISIRKDHASNYQEFEVGTYGLCISCGCEIDENLYCHTCWSKRKRVCDECGGLVDNLYEVRNRQDDIVYVCQECRSLYYEYCEDCEEYYPKGELVIVANGRHICHRCIEDDYTKCEKCGKWYRSDDISGGLCSNCRADEAEKGNESDKSNGTNNSIEAEETEVIAA